MLTYFTIPWWLTHCLLSRLVATDSRPQLLLPSCRQFSLARQISICTPISSLNLMILSSFFLLSHLKKITHKINTHSLLHPDTAHTLTPLIYLLLNMPGPDPRRTKPSAYTIPKHGSKTVGTRPPLHSGASASNGTKDDNPRLLTHQEIRRGKSKKPPVVTRNSARLPGTPAQSWACLAV